MRIVWIFSNALAVVTTLVCMSYLYYACRPVVRGKLPVISIVIIGVTATISGLQFVYPEILAALQRDPEAVRAGSVRATERYRSVPRERLSDTRLHARGGTAVWEKRRRHIFRGRARRSDR